MRPATADRGCRPRPGRRPSSMFAVVMKAPSVTASARSSISVSSAMPVTSTRIRGWTRRRLSIGPSDCAPATTHAAPSDSSRIVVASDSVRARTNSKTAGFIRASTVGGSRARGIDGSEDAFRGQRQIMDLGTDRAQRVVDRRDDRRRWANSPSFAQALYAELRVRRRRLHVQDADVGHFGRTRQHVVEHRGGERLSLRVERNGLVQTGTDALRGAAAHLAVYDHRIDQNAAVLDHHVVQDLDQSGLRIDRDDGGMGGVAECAAVAVGAVPGGDLETAGIDIGWQILRLQVPGAGNLTQRNA